MGQGHSFALTVLPIVGLALVIAGSGCSNTDSGAIAAGPDASIDSGKKPSTDGGASPDTGGGQGDDDDDDDTDAGSGGGDDAAPPGDDDAGPPGNLIQQLLDLTHSCGGSDIVSTHSYASNNGAPVDVCKLKGALYYTAKMAVDCDGKTTTHCPGTGADKDCCYYNDTSFHNPAGEPLSAELDPYIVIPLDFKYPGLDQDNGGNVVAVIYNNKLLWAVFGNQGPTDLIGEASYKTAQSLGINPSPASGGVNGDVTYIVFIGDGTQPHDMEDQAEVAQLGQKLATTLLKSN